MTNKCATVVVQSEVNKTRYLADIEPSLTVTVEYCMPRWWMILFSPIKSCLWNCSLQVYLSYQASQRLPRSSPNMSIFADINKKKNLLIEKESSGPIALFTVLTQTILDERNAPLRTSIPCGEYFDSDSMVRYSTDCVVRI